MKFNNMMIISRLEDILLLKRKSVMYQNTRNLDYFTKVGGRFTFFTRHPPFFLDKLYLARKLPLDSPIITLDGAMTYSYQKRDFQNYTLIDHHVGAELIGTSIDKFPDIGCQIYTHDNMYMVNNNILCKEDFLLYRIPFAYQDLSSLKSFKSWFRITFRHPSKFKLLELREHILQNYSQFVTAEIFEYNHLDIYSVDKSLAFSAFKLLNDIGIHENMAHFVAQKEREVDLVQKFENTYCPLDSDDIIKAHVKKIMPESYQPFMYYLIKEFEENY